LQLTSKTSLKLDSNSSLLLEYGRKTFSRSLYLQGSKIIFFIRSDKIPVRDPAADSGYF